MRRLYNKLIGKIAYRWYIGKNNKNLNPETVRQANLFCKTWQIKQVKKMEKKDEEKEEVIIVCAPLFPGSKLKGQNVPCQECGSTVFFCDSSLDTINESGKTNVSIKVLCLECTLKNMKPDAEIMKPGKTQREELGLE